MAAHSSILAWRIPWTEKPDGLQSMRSKRIGHDRVTISLSLFSKRIKHFNQYCFSLRIFPVCRGGGVGWCGGQGGKFSLKT